MSPKVRGLPIEVVFQPGLIAHRGKLLSPNKLKHIPQRGREVHAGSFLRERRIVLDAALKTRPRELARILIHELYHFAWVRLGNPQRRRYEDLLQGEMRKRVCGELGWSAERLKAALRRADRTRRTRAWREYVCESFCDSGAWLLAGRGGNEEFTLPAAARRVRRSWFEQAGLTLQISV
jgi:hypothetical protein